MDYCSTGAFGGKKDYAWGHVCFQPRKGVCSNTETAGV